MFCNQCGKVIEDGQAFCQNCGASLSGEKPQKKVDGKKVVLLAVIVGIVLFLSAVAGGVYYVISSGIFMPASEKVLAATFNTFRTSTELANTTIQMGKMLNDDFTMDIEGRFENIKISNATISMTEGRLQLATDIGFMGIKAKDCIADLDDDAIRLSVPKFYDKTVSYYYNEEAEMLEQISNGQLEAINEILKSINDATYNRNTSIDPEDYSVYKEWWNELEFETEKGVKAEIGDNKKKCTLYSVELDADDLTKLLDITEEFVNEHAKEKFETICKEHDMTVDEFFDNARSSIQENPDESIYLEFYVYKGKVVRLCITDQEEGAQIDIIMKGEKAPWMDTEIQYKDGENAELETVFTAQCDVDGETETYKLDFVDEGVVDLVYNASTGEYKVDIEDDGSNVASASGVLLLKDKEGTFAINSLYVDGNEQDVTVNSSLKAGAVFREYPDDELNLNDTDILDLMEAFGKIEDKFSFLF